MPRATADEEDHGKTHPTKAKRACSSNLKEAIGIFQRSLALRPLRPRGPRSTPRSRFVSGFPKRLHEAMCRMLAELADLNRPVRAKHTFLACMSRLSILRYGCRVHRALAEIWLKRLSYPGSQAGFIPFGDSTMYNRAITIELIGNPAIGRSGMPRAMPDCRMWGFQLSLTLCVLRVA